ncbi:MAG: DUF5681 domain-containing protein [Hyphomicrobiaceae bacterium]|jgi:hypothetical protein
MEDKTENPRDEAVGYGRPPKASQFKKGQSGNPLGRPPKSRSHRAIAGRVFGETQRVSGQPKGSRVRFTTLEVVVMTLKQLAAAGRSGASALYLRLSERQNPQATTQHSVGYLIVPEELTPEEWVSQYSPKDGPLGDPEPFD